MVLWYHNDNLHSTIKITPVAPSNNPEKVRNFVNTDSNTPRLKDGNYVRNADKRNKFSKR